MAKGTNKTKKRPEKEKITKDKIQVQTIDLERLFDTLYEYIRGDTERRRMLSLRAKELHRQKGRGMFVVSAMDGEGRIRSNVPSLFQGLQWWNHDRCVSEPLPEYLRTDPHYSPEIYQYLHSHDVDADFIVGMHWTIDGKGYCTMNTLGHYRGANTIYVTAGSNDLNPYGSEIGSTVSFLAKKCGAEGCDAVQAELKLCGRCHQIAYCSRECQVKDWKRHKASCMK